jgi:hypothetical protein
MDLKNIDVWNDDDRIAALKYLQTERANYYAESGKSNAELAKAVAKSQIELEVMWEAQRECARRYLDATGRSQYGTETLESEISFFKRLGEAQIVLRHKSSKNLRTIPLRPQ